MKMVNIPYFKQVIVMSTVCDDCGYRSNEVKTGGAVPEKGSRITLDVKTPEDLSRDVLKSESAALSCPELQLRVEPGTMGGRFTTVEGILENIKRDLRSQVFGLDGPTSAIYVVIPVLVFAVVFGLSMDYEVFLLSRIKEAYDRSGRNTAATMEGLSATASVITSAALIMILVFGIFAFARVLPMQLVGFGLAVAVPAVLGYNWLVRRNKVAMDTVRAFGSDLHTVLLAAGARREAMPVETHPQPQPAVA